MNFVTLGGYVPGTTPLHRMDARAKLACLAAVTAALLCTGSLPALVVALAICLALAAAAHVSYAAALRGFAPVAVALLVILLANGVRLDGTGDVALGALGLSLAGVVAGLAVACRILAMTACALAVCATTSQADLIDALLRVLRPLDRLGVPSADVAMTLTLALRFIPVCAERLARVRLAQDARGARVGQGSLPRRVMSWVPVMTPFVVSVFRYAEELARTLRIRCYGRGGSGNLVPRPLARRDVAAMAITCGACVVCAVIW